MESEDIVNLQETQETQGTQDIGSQFTQSQESQTQQPVIWGRLFPSQKSVFSTLGNVTLEKFINKLLF